MASKVFIIDPNEEVECYNTGGPKTVLQVKASSTAMVKILGFGISFDGVSITAEPVMVTLSKQTTDGTMTSTNPIKIGVYSEDILATAQYLATVEPGTTDAIESMEIHPQAGYEIRYPVGQEPIVGRGEHVGILVTASAAVNCRVKMICEE